MKQLIFLIVFLPAMLFAQRGEKIKAFKTAYITEELDLSPSEAEKFWPVYNQYDDLLMDLRRKERQEIFKKVKGDLDALSDAEASVLLDEITLLKSQEFKYHEEMLRDLKKVLPAKKILKLKRAEEDFKRMLLEKVKGKHRDRP